MLSGDELQRLERGIPVSGAEIFAGLCAGVIIVALMVVAVLVL